MYLLKHTFLLLIFQLLRYKIFGDPFIVIIHKLLFSMLIIQFMNTGKLIRI